MMPYQSKRARRPLVPLFILFGGIGAAVFLVLFFIFNASTVTIQSGNIEFETERSTVIVRDEQVYSAENYGKASFLASEGERVAQGTPIAQIYKWGYNDKIMSELLDVQTKIEQYQENNLLHNVKDSDLSAINTNIAVQSQKISGIINKTAEGDLIIEEKALKQLMDNKRQYLKDKVKADAQLEQYYDQESQLQEKVEGWRQTMPAPEAGVVSFYFDGCETLLNAKNIGQLTIKNINDIINGSTLSKAGSSDTQRPLYRLVNNVQWYLLIVTLTPIREFGTGTNFEIAFNDYPDKQYAGKVIGNRMEQESGYIYAIQINDDIGPLLNVRRADAKIHTTFTGMKVPSKAVKTVDKQQGVYLIENNQKKFVPVNVLIDQGGNSIIKAANEGDTLHAGQEIEE